MKEGGGAMSLSCPSRDIVLVSTSDEERCPCVFVLALLLLLLPGFRSAEVSSLIDFVYRSAPDVPFRCHLVIRTGPEITDAMRVSG